MNTGSVWHEAVTVVDGRSCRTYGLDLERTLHMHLVLVSVSSPASIVSSISRSLLKGRQLVSWRSQIPPTQLYEQGMPQ